MCLLRIAINKTRLIISLSLITLTTVNVLSNLISTAYKNLDLYQGGVVLL